MRDLIAALALLLTALIAPPAAAQSTTPDPAFKARLNDLVAVLNGKGDYDTLFG